MTYDAKRLKIMKWLDKLANNTAAYSKRGFHNINEILTIYGRLYATNDYVLAEVQYPEFEHLSDYGYMAIDRYTDENGYLLETPELREPAMNHRERKFSDMFVMEVHPNPQFKFNPKIMKDALYPFEVYKINPNIVLSERKCELTGHDEDVSIRVLFMGMR